MHGLRNPALGDHASASSRSQDHRAVSREYLRAVVERLRASNATSKSGDFGVRMHVLEGAAAVLRGFFLLCVGLIAGSAALGRVAVSLCSRFCSRLWRLPRQAISRVLPAARSVAAGAAVSVYLLPGLVLRLRWLFLIFFVGLAGWAAVSEMRSGHFQAGLFSYLARGMTFAVENGPSRAIEFPKTGPYDERLGYHKTSRFYLFADLEPICGRRAGSVVAASRAAREAGNFSDLPGERQGGAADFRP